MEGSQRDAVTVAGIDCGTNSIRLKIARVDADGTHDIVPRMLRVIRLGQDVDKTHRFADEALERADAAVREFADVLAEHPVDGIRFVATSATRDAENREVFESSMERILGVRPEVIPGSEEAALSFLGATCVAPRHDLAAPYLVVDLGGGSTELVLGGDGVSAPDTQVQAAFSMNIGSVRMTERHLRSDPPTTEEIREAATDIDEHIDEAFQQVPAGKTRTIIGVSGTVTTMTALALGLKEYDHKAVDGVRIPFSQAFDVDNQFLNMTRAERSEYVGSSPTGGTFPIQCPHLLMPQGVNWVEAGGSAGGVVAEKDADGDADADCEHDRLRGSRGGNGHAAHHATD
jgi:exopolyphosphatase/guanosine-5'-triphosphate,3'-diphosphate pyrophosphatase